MISTKRLRPEAAERELQQCEADPARFIAALKAIVGDAQVLTDAKATRAYRTGFRCGAGQALAVVRPRSLVEQWRVLKACVAADKIVIAQAANTGLTGGSTPDGEDYDREVVVVNTMRIGGIHPIDEGRQVICLAGATLSRLEQVLQRYGREPHSVIGSSCIGASVIGGVCNNSGGALIHRGPAYTQLALFARADETGQLQLVNHLGVKLGDDPEEILGRLERGEFGTADIEHDPHRHASDSDYLRRVREIDSDRPARYNAEPGRLFEASGCAGKLMVFAVRVDTFPKPRGARVFYVGTNDPAEFATIRRHMLAQFKELPIAAEYLHRRAFDIAERYGRDTFLAIRHLGTERLPALFALKARMDSFAGRLGMRTCLSDKLLQGLGRLFPNPLPSRMRLYRDRFEHYLILKVSEESVAQTQEYLRSIFPSAQGDFFECTEEEAAKAFLHRFAAAGAAIRFRALRSDEVEDILALDIALRRNDREWFETLPPDIAAQMVDIVYYGHFFCHVFHQDYIVRKGCDIEALKRALLKLLDSRGAEYPAEHNVGHLYLAKPELAGFYRTLDPRNQFNPGIGQTSRFSHWR